MARWKPIESAPKDGSTIVLLAIDEYSGSGTPLLGRWDATAEAFMQPNGYAFQSDFCPTHWRRLPKPNLRRWLIGIGWAVVVIVFLLIWLAKGAEWEALGIGIAAGFWVWIIQMWIAQAVAPLQDQINAMNRTLLDVHRKLSDVAVEIERMRYAGVKPATLEDDESFYEVRPAAEEYGDE
ncbi:hypothetical protein [Microbaculum sp. FT89]|uniref:hypothetical protein n=1 Tax=Microbaculum sp. FT89 TaxID=3447298 RepID=UPI003F534981